MHQVRATPRQALNYRRLISRKRGVQHLSRQSKFTPRALRFHEEQRLQIPPVDGKATESSLRTDKLR